MKILAIMNEDNNQNSVELLDDLQEENTVEIVNLEDYANDYDGIVEKIEQCDKVISW